MKFTKRSPWSPPFNLKSVVLGKRAVKGGSEEQEKKQDCRIKQEQPSAVETQESSPRRGSYSSPRMSSQGHYFAQFKDVLRTKEHIQEEDEHRRYSTSPCAGAGGSGNSSPALGRNVIARLMGLDDATTCSPSTTSSAARTPRSPRGGIASSGSISKSPRQAYKLVQTADYEKRKPSQELGLQQNFLDEMENHLQQCDRALERIEAVMQLKKKLLCKQQQQRIRTYRHTTREESRCRRLEVEHGHLTHPSEYCHHSPRSISPRTPKAEQQRHYTRSARFWEAEEVEEGCDYYYNSPRLRRPTPEIERQQLKHHKSVSYSVETPVFSPSSYSYEEAARALRVSLAHPPIMYLNNRHITSTARSSTRPTVEEACGLSRSFSTRNRNEHKPPGVEVSNEQPSPVSVLESNAHDEASPASSDDYKDSRRCTRLAETRRTSGSKVVRALWAVPAPPTAVTTEKCQKQSVTTTMEDLDLLTWSGDNKSEVGEIAFLLECLIFKRLLEETIRDMELMHPTVGGKR